MGDNIYVVIEHLQGQVSEISYVMLAAGRALASGIGGELVAILLGHQAQNLAGDLAADRVLYMDDPALAEFTPDAYQLALAELIKTDTPRAVLLGDTSVGAEVAGALSVRLEIPLVSRCSSVHAKEGTPKFVSQICGGKIMAEGDLPGPTALVTMVPGDFKAEEGQSDQPAEVTSIPAPSFDDLKVTLKQYIEPEVGDVDISTEPILIAVGRGIQQEANLELAEELAAALGGTICASRPVVDQGWLPISRLVGKSGKSVKPKLFLAIGISGAPEHVEAVTGSETIIAINTDPAAPIFDIAKYGANVDLFELVPALTEQLQGS
ncbi:MAG: electron transfer flavoprotein subunit alpha/FixB family protein [Anaerolineaceae bacterium]|nr:MAG: electron transfer flavoprotein subunit alpha/FixB family protein [Anaerolineaceae bacterium]